MKSISPFKKGAVGINRCFGSIVFVETQFATKMKLKTKKTLQLRELVDGDMYSKLPSSLLARDRSYVETVHLNRTRGEVNPGGREWPKRIEMA